MAGITQEQAETALTQWLAADTAITEGQEFELSVNGVVRKVKLTDAALIRKNIEYWDSWCRRLAKGGIAGRRGAFA